MDTANQNFLSLSLMMKATVSEEAGTRHIYLEASDESLDAQSEVVMQKALADSMEYYLARGNFDIDHITMTGLSLGIPDYLAYEVGRPTEVKLHGGKTLVKGVIYSGSGPAAVQANQFWSSLVDIQPSARWFPSVGGSIQESEIVINKDTLVKSRKITKVRWSNIGFSRQPVNQNVRAVSTVPLEQFAKSWATYGFFKTLEAGYGTDVSQLTGAGALRKQSLHGYPQYRNRMAGLILDGVISAKDIVKESISRFGLTERQAKLWANHFFKDLS